MLRNTIILLFFTFNLLSFNYANSNEIWITPNADEYSRLSTGLAGSFITIIDEEEIRKSKHKNVAEVIASYSGIQIRSTLDGVEGSYTTIDMRGFGEAAKSNSLILINGRILNDFDMSAVDFSSINLDSIDRIEIIRGSSASTIYGPGAIGGAINIITKSSKDLDNQLNFSIGSFKNSEGKFLLQESIDEDQTITVSGKIISSDTYRDAANFDQASLLGNYSYDDSEVRAYLDLSINEKEQLLPGPRIIGGYYNYHLCNLYSSSHTAKNIGGWDNWNATYGALYGLNNNLCNVNQRDDYANTDTMHARTGVRFNLDELTKVYLNTSYKDKIQKSFSASNSNTISVPANGDRYIHTEVDGNTFDFRVEKKSLNEKNSNIFTLGLDRSHTFYLSNRYRKEGESLGQSIDADQKSSGIYFQNSFNIFDSSMVLSSGFRYQETEFQGRSQVDTGVSGFAWATAHTTYNETNQNTAYNIGLEKKVDPFTSIFLRYSKGFRTPNIDERIKATNSGSFSLKDQTSDDIEFGIRSEGNKTKLVASVFVMDTENEIQYNQSVNTNLDPIERNGFNLDLKYQIDEKHNLKASVSYVNAEFTSGSLTPGGGGASSCDYTNTTYCSNSSTWQNLMGGGTSYSLSGKSVPLVAPLNYNILIESKINVSTFFDVELEYTDEKYVSNDQENIEPKIPDYYILNTKFRSDYRGLDLMFGVNNLFDKDYYDFSVSSTFHDDNHYGTQAVYPLSGRNIFFDLGYTF
mgnify:CR=1 FL=1